MNPYLKLSKSYTYALVLKIVKRKIKQRENQLRKELFLRQSPNKR